jgi:hypothetical protein
MYANVETRKIIAWKRGYPLINTKVRARIALRAMKITSRSKVESLSILIVPNTYFP